MTEKKLTTLAVTAGIDTDKSFGAVIPPLVLSSNFSFKSFGEKRKYDYSRSANPTRDLLGECLADLENGAGSVITATGLAAAKLAITLLNPGDTLVIPHDCYGGSWRLFTSLASKGHFKLEIINFSDHETVIKTLELKPRLVWLETPSNPLLRILDLEWIINLSKKQGALVAVDNTFLSPLWQQPISFGADLVIHSTTKYLNGHSDVVGGAVVAKDQELLDQLVWWGNALGITGSPFDSYLTLRGIRTLSARLKVHQENALIVVEELKKSQVIKQLFYPGISTHPGHIIAAKQQKSFGAMISFELPNVSAAKVFVENARMFTLAESLGGVESLIAHPATMTHASMSREAREVAGISDGLLRLSIGIEDSIDLINDINFALNKVEDYLSKSNFGESELQVA